MQFNMNLQSFAQEVKSIRSPSVVGRLNKAQKWNDNYKIDY